MYSAHCPIACEANPGPEQGSPPGIQHEHRVIWALEFDDVPVAGEHPRHEDVHIVGAADAADVVGDGVGVAEGPAVASAPFLVRLLVRDTPIEELAKLLNGQAQLLKPYRSLQRHKDLFAEVFTSEPIEDFPALQQPQQRVDELGWVGFARGDQASRADEQELSLLSGSGYSGVGLQRGSQLFDCRLVEVELPSSVQPPPAPGTWVMSLIARPSGRVLCGMYQGRSTMRRLRVWWMTASLEE